VHQVILPKIISDHFPILLKGKKVPFVRRPFKFENMCFEVKGFSDLVKSFRDELNVCLVPQVLSGQRGSYFSS